LGNGIPSRDKAVNIDKFLQPDPLSNLIEENDDIDTDDGVVDNRIIFSWYGVAQGNHFTSCKISDHQQSWGYEEGPWKGPGPPLLVAVDF